MPLSSSATLARVSRRPSSPDAWFSVGRFEVTTTLFLVAVVLIGMVASVLVGPMFLAFSPSALMEGQLWRLATWPLAQPLGLSGLLMALMLYWFAGDLERQIGRVPLARLVGTVALVPLALAVLIWLVARTDAVVAGLGVVEFVLLMVWIADNPRRPFFLGIPAWIVGAVLGGLQVLTLLAARDVAGLLMLLAAGGAGAVMARRLGLLRELRWLPARAPRAQKPARQQRVRAKQEASTASDRASLDALLDKISASGLHSLTPRERQQLSTLRERLRQQR